uniref:Putative inactive gylcosyltransferase n=1 Tax=Streptomyces tendae TaxID=1932 RepID=A7DWJ3_STRTE|nr:putative inactive gylcosyltransferase [Streptomyces tendae]
MRVLFTTWAWPSHLYSLVPFAWACRTAGHEVLIAGQPSLADEITRCGLPAARVGGEVDAVGMVRGYLLGRASPGRGGGGPRAMEMFRAHADAMLDDLVRLARDTEPDVVVYEPTALAGPLAAAAAGVPSVRHLYGTDLMARARGVLSPMLAELGARHGIRGADPYGSVTVDPVPPGLRLPAAPPAVPVRYVPFNGPGRAVELPPPLRPRVCVTWGHTLAKLSADRFLAPAVARALAVLDIEVVVAVSAAQQELLGPLPDGVRVVVDAPLDGVVRDCDLVVAHGGAATVLTALSHGVPLLLVPQLPDHAGHAARVAAAGAGDLLPHDAAGPERLREYVARLLGDERYRQAARRLRQQMHDQPPPAALAADLPATVRCAA